MPANRAEVQKLPDQLVIRYFGEGELDLITAVTVGEKAITVQLADGRLDRWRDLGGGSGYIFDPGD